MPRALCTDDRGLAEARLLEFARQEEDWSTSCLVLKDGLFYVVGEPLEYSASEWDEVREDMLAGEERYVKAHWDVVVSDEARRRLEW